MTIGIESTIGVYLTIIEDHQLFVEYDMSFLPDPVESERNIEIGAVALGYNVYLVDALELISQISLDIPQENETVSVGFITGLIATLPTNTPTVAETEKLPRDEKRRVESKQKVYDL